jgi:hypothetical protein
LFTNIGEREERRKGGREKGGNAKSQDFWSWLFGD